jgi:hypothetical protein
MLILIVFFMSSVSAKFLAQDAPKKSATRISFESTQNNTGELTLKGILKARLGRSYANMPGFELSFYSLLNDEESLISDQVTDANGEAFVTIQEADLSIDTAGAMQFLVRFDGNDTLRSRESDLLVYRAQLDIEGVEEDSLKFIDLKVTRLKSGVATAAADENVSLYVPRMFSNLKIGEETSDENGEIRIPFPPEIRGDAEGNLKLIAMVEESEAFGNLQAELDKQWGIPLTDASLAYRSLFSPNPPIWMVLTFAIMMLAVWGHYIVIIYKMYRIKRPLVK